MIRGSFMLMPFYRDASDIGFGWKCLRIHLSHLTLATVRKGNATPNIPQTGDIVDSA